MGNLISKLLLIYKDEISYILIFKKGEKYVQSKRSLQRN